MRSTWFTVNLVKQLMKNSFCQKITPKYKTVHEKDCQFWCRIKMSHHES